MRHLAHRHRLSRYLLASVFPYLCLALLILTATLFLQQSGRFLEILGNAQAPLKLIVEIAIGLLPNVLVLTLPMAVVVGTVTGLSRLSSDSEIIAMRAAGVSPLQLAASPLFLGLLLSVVNFSLAFAFAPSAAHLLRQVALEAASYKLESPIEPHTFNTEIPGKVVYVSRGIQSSGRWESVFIQWQDPNAPLRLLTASSGHLDTNAGKTELVLDEAVITSFSTPLISGLSPDTQIITEHSKQFRVRLSTGRNETYDQAFKRSPQYDEMSWGELRQRQNQGIASDRRDAETTMQKRLALSFAPMVFAIFGAGLGGLTKKRERGSSLLWSLLIMVIYYLLTIAGEQLGHQNILPLYLGIWLANGLIFFIGLALIFSLANRCLFSMRRFPSRFTFFDSYQRRPRYSISSFALGRLDFSFFRKLCWFYLLAQLTLVLIFIVFTLFELLKYFNSPQVSVALVCRYLLFLSPLALISLTPMSVLIAALATYAVTAKKNEVLGWWAGGQSTFRLAVPALLMASTVTFAFYGLQEYVLPFSNRTQDALRALIRNNVPRRNDAAGRQWLISADGSTIYSFVRASAIEQLDSPTIYELTPGSTQLLRIITGPSAFLKANSLDFATALIVDFQPQRAISRETGSFSLAHHEPLDAFLPIFKKPSDLSTDELHEYTRIIKRQATNLLPIYQLALTRRQTDLLGPLIMILIGLPLGIAFGKRSTVAALSAAVVIGLMFLILTQVSQQLGLYGLLPISVAAWTPPVIFLSVGMYTLSKVKT